MRFRGILRGLKLLRERFIKFRRILKFRRKVLCLIRKFRIIKEVYVLEKRLN